MKLSIITINYNNVSGLSKTVESIVPHLSEDMEYLVIDGGSTDGSVDIIEKNKEKFGYCVSEPDSGIYNAMNKGVSTMTIVQNTLKATSGDMDEAAKNSLRGSMELLDKSLSILDSTTGVRTAGRTMKDVMDEQLDKFDTDNRFLFIDP